MLDFSDSAANGSTEFLHSTKLSETELQSLYPNVIMQQDMQVVLEENEALRTGMHEILDSIRNQDGEFSLILMVL